MGDTGYELTARCGSPVHRTVLPSFRTETVLDPFGNGIQRIVEETVEVLTFAGEGGDLPRLVTVRRGLVASIRTLDRVQAEAEGCAQATLGSNPTLGEVHLACGRPVDRSRWTEERGIRVGGIVLRGRIPFEKWVYDPGPGRLLRILKFENGRLVSVKTGGRSPLRD